MRRLTLREEGAPTSDIYRALLFVAEIVAEIIYNASDAPAPFDTDSPWWLAPNARGFVVAVDPTGLRPAPPDKPSGSPPRFAPLIGGDEVGRAVWCALTGA